jgi:hypothetical protein
MGGMKLTPWSKKIEWTSPPTQKRLTARGKLGRTTNRQPDTGNKKGGDVQDAQKRNSNWESTQPEEAGEEKILKSAPKFKKMKLKNGDRTHVRTAVELVMHMRVTNSDYEERRLPP